MGTTPATIQQLINAGTDCETIADVATKQADTTIDRLGNTKSTLYGMNARMDAAIGAAGYEAGAAYTSGLVISRNRQTVLVGSNRYFPKRSLPFTTGATFTASDWYQMGGWPDFSGSGGVASNTVIGLNSLTSNTSGSNNTAFGNLALPANTTGSGNTVFGVGAGLTNIDGLDNTYVGAQAGWKAVSAQHNTCLGKTAGLENVTGNYNVFIGRNAGRNSLTDGNTAIGSNALGGGIMNTATNCSGVGRDAAVTASNQVQLGNSATTTYVYGTVQNRSDIRDKTDVSPTTLGLSFITSLTPIDYRWDMREDYKKEIPELSEEPSTAEKKEHAKIVEQNKLKNIVRDGSKKRTRKHHGFIAQEVGEKFPEFGGFQDHKVTGGEDVLSLGYDEFIAPMVKAIQELHDIVKAQQLEINKLKGEA